MKHPRKRILLASSTIGAATIVAIACAAISIEFWVRSTWDPLKGSPGLFESSPTRIEQLAPNYEGYYTGVPLKTNNLGFRDNRDYEVAKGPSTIRIAILGDSVTFGHGSLYESTYPYLLEQKLKSWHPAIDWQVWNLGVPGYNASQIQAHLSEVESNFKPDLVIIGFFENDLYGNRTITASEFQRFLSHAKNFFRRYFYSFHFYKKAYLQFHAAMFESEEHAYRLANLALEQRMLFKLERMESLGEQTITGFSPVAVQDDSECKCKTDSVFAPLKPNDPGFPEWNRALREIASLGSEGPGKIHSFINIAPNTCPPPFISFDRFCHGAYGQLNTWLVETLQTQGPVVSSYDTFYQYKPSDMPLAGGHALGNANEVKAQTLLRHLQNNEFMGLLLAEKFPKT